MPQIYQLDEIPDGFGGRWRIITWECHRVRPRETEHDFPLLYSKEAKLTLILTAHSVRIKTGTWMGI